MPMGLIIKEALELRRINQVSVVRKADAVGAIDVEWLGLCIGTTSGRGISQVT